MDLSMLLSLALASDAAPEKPFPDPMPGMIENCLLNAVERKSVSKTEDSWKYICTNAPAEALWKHLVSLNIESWEQTVSNGTWVSRAFPLGGCFRQLKDSEGNTATDGLSCTVWIPRK